MFILTFNALQYVQTFYGWRLLCCFIWSLRLWQIKVPEVKLSRDIIGDAWSGGERLAAAPSLSKPQCLVASVQRD